MHNAAITRCTPEDDEAEAEEAVRKAVDLIGGPGRFVNKGDRVLVKPNLVADPTQHPYAYLKGVNSFGTDGRVVAALVHLLREAGASKVAVGECEDFKEKYEHYGYAKLCRGLDVELLDLNLPPYAEVDVPDGLVYKSLNLNAALLSYDHVISAAKLKVHAGTGVSLCIKNLMGLTPTRYYHSAGQRYSSRDLYHRTDPRLGSILPYVLVDLALAFKVRLCVVEGIVASDKTEHFNGLPVETDIILAGDNLVATDAVGAAVMGFNPESEQPNIPFLSGRNHLSLATSLGLGSHRLADVRLSGEPIESVKRSFAVDLERRATASWRGTRRPREPRSQ